MAPLASQVAIIGGDLWRAGFDALREKYSEARLGTKNLIRRRGSEVEGREKEERKRGREKIKNVLMIPAVVAKMVSILVIVGWLAP